MRVTDADRRMLDGGEGQVVAEAMEYLVKLGDAFEAEELVDVDSVHLFTDWMLMDEAGLQLYKKFADRGARVRVHSSCEPIGFDLTRWEEFRLPAEFYAKQAELNGLLRKMGCVMTYSCLIYLGQNVPKFGDNLAWIEGNATGWANSVVGARGNRESPITCLMSALTGRIPKHGLLREENRRAEVIVEIDDKVIEHIGGPGRTAFDYGNLGMIVGDLAFDRVPAVVGLPRRMKIEELKAFCSMCSPALTTTLILMVGLSPEAPTLEAALRGRKPADVPRYRVTMDDLERGRESLCRIPARLDGVLTGCPFKNIYELQELAELLDGKRLRDDVFFWVYTDRTIHALAESSGLKARIERSGARLYHDACAVMIPHGPMFGPDKVFATDSVKLIRLTRGIGKPSWRFGSLPELIDAAVAGQFTPVSSVREGQA